MRILIVEDSRRLGETLRSGLRRSGFAVDLARDGNEGLRLAVTEPFDVVVLDLNLPGLSGLEILKTLRERELDREVLILSARDTVEDRVEGLKLGADDYLVKPFAFEELLARINALTRRRYAKKDPVLAVGDLEIETATRTVRRAGRVLSLTAREYALLRLLATRQGETVSRIEIEDKLYGIDRFPNSNVIAATLSVLRGKLGDPPLIRTRRGLGYVMEAPEA